ncbi:alpha/beta fold hydrolase [Deinococcus ruber]|nr:alpha/beta fold hydrolase [Deinococcus ruber]
MKKRYVAAALLGLLVVGFAGAQALTSQAGSSQLTTLPAPAGSMPPTSTLTAAFSADRYSFVLPDFGNVGYYVDKTGTGRPLLLLTSINAAASAYEMRPIFQAYRGSRPVYVLEWPGFGSSDRPDVRYTPELMTSALKAMVDIIGADVDVVALSLGSEFAARGALTEPRIRSLVLISPTGMGSAQGTTQEAAATEKAQNLYNGLAYPLWSGALYALIASPPSIRYFLSGSFEGAPDQGLVDYSYVSTRQPGAKYAPLYFISGLLFNADAYNALYSKLTQPVLVLYDKDRFVNFDRLPEFVAAHPNAQAVRITPTRGLPQFEQMQQVKAALDAFWAQK